MEKKTVEVKKQKSENPKIGKIYVIYSPSLDIYYIGSTFLALSLRKAIHKYQYRHNKKFITSFHVLKNNDAEFKTISTHNDITKNELLKIEKLKINEMIKLHGGKVINNNCDKTINIKEYMKEYRDIHSNYYKEYGKMYRLLKPNYNKEYRIKNLEEINLKRKNKYETEKRKEIIEKLNNNAYINIPAKKIELIIILI
jgi:hypothetical protein